MDRNFELQEELLKLQQRHASDYFILNELDIEQWSEDEVETRLDELIDAWGEDCSTIADPVLFDAARSCIKKFQYLSDKAKNKLVLVVVTGLRSHLSQCKEIDED